MSSRVWFDVLRRRIDNLELTGGGGGGTVTSVNGVSPSSGNVVLTATNVGAMPTQATARFRGFLTTHPTTDLQAGDWWIIYTTP